MNGVSTEASSNGKSILFVISDISAEMKRVIRANLASICHGAARAGRSPRTYSYQQTLHEFMKRYETKSTDTKKGMLGELLAHILLLDYRTDMHPATPFFNLEERSIKKGFDLVLYQKAEHRIWITEVKAGESPNASSSAKTKALLHLAKTDLLARLNSGKSSLWHNAISGAFVAIGRKKIKDAVVEILEKSLRAADASILNAAKVNVILVSVLYKNLRDTLVLQDIVDTRSEIKGQNIFHRLIVVSFQKGTFQKIERFLQAEISE